MSFEQRNVRVMINLAGGNAGTDSQNYRISLPSAWMNTLGIDQQNRKVVLQFDGEKITIQKVENQNYDTLLNEIQKEQHHALVLYFYENDTLCTKICADQDTRQIAIQNMVENIWQTAFGVNKFPTWSDLESFLENRCLPKERDGMQYYLDEIGLDRYDPLAIIRKTGGRMAEDHHWIRIVEE